MPEPSLSAVERFPEKISDPDAENFESHVFEGYT